MSRGTRRRARRGVLLLVAVSIGAGAAGCAIEKRAAPVPLSTPPYVSTVEQPDLVATWPLRGSPASDAAARPALAAKVDNHEEARPQYGLDRADVVFEEMVEGGLTRYVAVWHSDVPELIGPVRSIRPMDPDIISPFGGIVAYSGGQQIFVDMMRDTAVVNAIHGESDTDETFFRIDEKDSPHDVVVKAPEVVAAHQGLAPPAAQFAFAMDAAASTAATSGSPVSRIDTVFSDERYPHWQWDAGRGQYLRFQEGEPDADAAGTQLGAVNVIAMRVSTDWTYGAVPKTVMIGSGEVFVSTGGSTVHGTWTKADRGAAIRLTDDSGATIRLAPGGTWIELVPETGSVSLQP